MASSAVGGTVCGVCRRPHFHRHVRNRLSQELMPVCSENCRHLAGWRMPLPANPTPVQAELAVMWNRAFRTTIYTTPPDVGAASGAFQITAMSIDTEAGWEQHPRNAQTFVVVSGTGVYRTNPEHPGLNDPSKASSFPIRAGSTWTVQPCTYHNIVNVPEGDFSSSSSSSGPPPPLCLKSTYNPPHHTVNRVDRTKEAADRREAAELASGDE